MGFLYSTTASGGGEEEEMKTAILTSQNNGSNQIFTLPENYSSGTTRLYYNGVREDGTWTESAANQITLSFVPTNLLSIVVDYYPAS